MAHILVVDDEPLLADLLLDVLESEDHKVRTAENGRQAIELIAAHPPDLIVTDFMMPAMIGLELAQHLALTSSPIPIILIAGAQAAIARQHAPLFSCTLEKPYCFEIVLARINHILGDGAGR